MAQSLVSPIVCCHSGYTGHGWVNAGPIRFGVANKRAHFCSLNYGIALTINAHGIDPYHQRFHMFFLNTY